jgi:hypothetical protein
MVATALVTLWIWRRSPPESPCDAREITRVSSPDGSMQADMFELVCGESVTTHVALHPASSSSSARSDVFIAAGRVPVRISWPDPRELTVESDAPRILVMETRWRDVSVRIRRTR